MNIFVLDEDPGIAAAYHNDRHVVKMILETAQLLTTAHYVLGGHCDWVSHRGAPLRPTHMAHPCTVWAGASSGNYEWLYALFTALLRQFAARYGHQHGYARTVYPALVWHPRGLCVASRTPWPQCMPVQYQQADPVLAYRAYYCGAKRHLAQWSAPAVIPPWWEGTTLCEVNTTIKGEAS